MKRKDATLDSAPVFCNNASRIHKHSAAPGDLLTFNTGDGKVHLARVVGRVSAPARPCSKHWGREPVPCDYCTPEVKDWLCVVVLADDMNHAYEVWVDPDWVRNIEKVTIGHLSFWEAFLTRDPHELMRLAECGSLNTRGQGK
jgi:hypothetical protein